MVPAVFEDIHEAGHVGVDVRVGIFEAVAHACLRCQVYDGVEGMLVEDACHAVPVREVELPECKGRKLPEHVQTVALELRIVVGIEVVGPEDLDSLAEKPPGKVVSDETGCAGHKHLHSIPPLLIDQ